MAIMKGEVEAVSTKFGKFSVMVNGNWYSTKMEYAKVQPNKGDLIEFDSKGGKYLNNVKILGGPVSSYPTGSKKSSGGKAWSNLGVELGHASNVAKDITIASFHGKESEIGSDDFYKVWVAQTEKVFNVMKMLRSKHESEEEEKVTPAETSASEVTVLDKDTLKDIFK